MDQEQKPKHWQFKKGQSGNPKGRPRGAVNKPRRLAVASTVIADPSTRPDDFMVLVTIQQLARAKTTEAIQALAEALKDKAYRVAAAIALLDRGWGKPAQAVDLNIRKTVREMSDEELLAIAAGGTPMLPSPDPLDLKSNDNNDLG